MNKVGWLHPESCNQQLNVQVEISDGWWSAGSVLFNNFNNGVDSRTECTLRKLVNDTKLSGAADMIVLRSALGHMKDLSECRLQCPEDSLKDDQRAATPLL